MDERFERPATPEERHYVHNHGIDYCPEVEINGKLYGECVPRPEEETARRQKTLGQYGLYDASLDEYPTESHIDQRWAIEEANPNIILGED